MFEVAYEVIGRNGQLLCKRRSFKTEKAREKNMSKHTVCLVENAAARCHTPFLRHVIENMGMRVLTIGDSGEDRMEIIIACIRESDAVLITGKPDTEMAVVAGAAYALERPVIYLCSADDLTSPNVTAAASKIIFDSSEVLAELQATLHP